MNTKIARLGMAFALCGFAMAELPCSGQENSIVLCGVELRIGMPKDDVLSKIGESCKLRSYGRDSYGREMSVVMGGGDGELFFDGDALSSVSKTLAFGADAPGILADFLAAINRAVSGTVSTLGPGGSGKIQNTSHTAVVTVNTSLMPDDGNGGPGFVFQELQIRVAQKTFIMEVSRRVGTGKPAVAVEPIVCKETLLSK